jgi:Bacterial regulatory proteins, luxR family
VALAVGRGCSNAEIAADLHMSVATVKAHVSRLLDKLDAANRVQVALTVQDAQRGSAPASQIATMWTRAFRGAQVAACASADGLWRLTIAGASWTRSSSWRASTMNRAKSTRRCFRVWVAHVPTPHRQTVALALLEVAAPHDGPARAAGEHPPARLHLVVDVEYAGQACETPYYVDEDLEPPRIDVVAVTGVDSSSRAMCAETSSRSHE